MASIKTLIKLKTRGIIQLISTLAINAKLNNYFTGKIYNGNLKKLCVPGLNCSSCPGALGSCPIGAMQAVLNNIRFNFSFYVIGFVTLIGVLFGRFICGFLCPFGFIQDLINKIPLKNRKLPKVFSYLKYLVLLVFVIILPIFVANSVGIGSPAFCKYICPAGTLGAGIPLVLLNKSLQSAIGTLFAFKLSILIVIVLLCVIFYRFFCKAMCPLGAIYGLLNKVSFYQYHVDKTKCITCNKCIKECKMDVNVISNPNSTECIRCGSCKAVCPTKAISSGFLIKEKSKKNNISLTQ